MDYRDRALELVEQGYDVEWMLLCMLKAMSQDTVKWALEANEYPLSDDEDDDDE